MKCSVLTELLFLEQLCISRIIVVYMIVTSNDLYIQNHNPVLMVNVPRNQLAQGQRLNHQTQSSSEQYYKINLKKNYHNMQIIRYIFYYNQTVIHITLSAYNIGTLQVYSAPHKASHLNWYNCWVMNSVFSWL